MGINILILWLTIIFIILPIVVEWYNIKPLIHLMFCSVYWNIEIIDDNYIKFEIYDGTRFEYHKGISIGNSTFRFDKPHGISVLFPPLHLIWLCVYLKLKNI